MALMRVVASVHHDRLEYAALAAKVRRDRRELLAFMVGGNDYRNGRDQNEWMANCQSKRCELYPIRGILLQGGVLVGAPGATLCC
jgi:hypothetical protein